MQARIISLLLFSAILPANAYADHSASCDVHSSNRTAPSVAVLEGELRSAIGAAAKAGCDPFGGLMARPACGDHIAKIRSLAGQVELAALSGRYTDDDADCAVHVVAHGGQQVDFRRGAASSGRATGILPGVSSSASAEPHAIPPERLQVRTVGPIYLPHNDARFEEISKGVATLPDSAASEVVSWFADGHLLGSTEKADRLSPADTIATASSQ